MSLSISEKFYNAGSQGQKTDLFNTLIYTTISSDAIVDSIEIPLDTMACMIDVYEVIDLDTLRTAYNRIAAAKKFKKLVIPQANGIPRTESVGIIFSVKAEVSLEILAEELQRLNQQTPGTQWPDMVVVLSQGIINYSIQFPGEEKPGDNFLIPAENVIRNTPPAMYIVPVMRPTGQYTFNNMCGFLCAHLGIFSPGVELPKWKEIIEGSSSVGVTLAGYQFNLSGELLPVSPQFYIGRYLPQQPHVFKDKHHDISFFLQFVPWQDGGVILLRGKMPLQAFLIYLGDKTRNRLSVVSRDNELQISSVLPITEEDYLLMLQKIQQQTSFKLQKEEVSIIKKKYADEGASSPFMARLFIGILTLRDAVFQSDIKRNEFEKIYHALVTKLCDLRINCYEIVKLFLEHEKRVTSGEIAYVEGRSIRVKDDIDRKLRNQVDHFIIETARIFKHGMQKLVEFFGVNIGFLYQKDNAFQDGINVIKDSDQNLADYLYEIRDWSGKLTKIRIDVEHNMLILSEVK